MYMFDLILFDSIKLTKHGLILLIHIYCWQFRETDYLPFFSFESAFYVQRVHAIYMSDQTQSDSTSQANYRRCSETEQRLSLAIQISHFPRAYCTEQFH